MIYFLLPCFQDRLFCVSCTFKLTLFKLLCKHISAQSVSGLHLYLQTTKAEVCDCVCVSFSVMYSPLSFFWARPLFPLTFCFAPLRHLSLLRVLLCVSCQVLDIIYDFVLCPDCETPDKTSISATNTKSVGSLLHLPLNYCVYKHVNTR